MMKIDKEEPNIYSDVHWTENGMDNRLDEIIPETVHIFVGYFLHGKAEKDAGYDIIVANINTLGDNLHSMQNDNYIYEVNLYIKQGTPPKECIVIQGKLLNNNVHWASRKGGIVCYKDDKEVIEGVLKHFKDPEKNYIRYRDLEQYKNNINYEKRC